MLVLHLQAAVTEALDVRLEALALLEKIVDVGGADILRANGCQTAVESALVSCRQQLAAEGAVNAGGQQGGMVAGQEEGEGVRAEGNPRRQAKLQELVMRLDALKRRL